MIIRITGLHLFEKNFKFSMLAVLCLPSLGKICQVTLLLETASDISMQSKVFNKWNSDSLLSCEKRTKLLDILRYCLMWLCTPISDVFSGIIITNEKVNVSFYLTSIEPRNPTAFHQAANFWPKSASLRAGVGPLFSPGISGPRLAHFFHGSGN